MEFRTHSKKRPASTGEMRGVYQTNQQMNIIKKNHVVLLLGILFLFQSCAYPILNFTVIGTKDNNLKMDISKGLAVEGSCHAVLGIGASIEKAMNRALQSAGPDYDLLVNGQVKEINYYYFVTGYKVSGTAVSTSKMKAQMGVEAFEEWCKANKINTGN
jgi:hypothetical protein